MAVTIVDWALAAIASTTVVADAMESGLMTAMLLQQRCWR